MVSENPAATETGDRAEEQRRFRNALGRFATGVTVVTARGPGGEDVGVTANSFNSVSLDPPLVLWSIARNATSIRAFEAAEHFAVHVLGEGQRPLSERFAQKGGDKFAGLALDRGVGGVPLVAGTAAVFQCRTAHRYEGGDHLILVGEVVEFDERDHPPLLYHGGRYAAVAASASPVRPPVRFELDTEGIATITLDRPEQRNAITDADVVDALVAACDRLQSDPAIRAAILTGAGPVFSSGGNLKAMAPPDGRAAQSPQANREWYLRGIQRIPRAFDRIEVPVIAAVNGPAIGAGCDLACMADIRVAARSATFAESFVKVGLVPGDGGAFLLPRVIGQARARELALTGETIDAAQALAWGLVSHVVEDGALLAKAREIARKIAANPPYAVRMTKRLLRAAERQDLDAVLEMSAGFQSIAHATEDHAEAVTAFLEKRPPAFKGR